MDVNTVLLIIIIIMMVVKLWYMRRLIKATQKADKAIEVAEMADKKSEAMLDATNGWR